MNNPSFVKIFILPGLPVICPFADPADRVFLLLQL